MRPVPYLSTALALTNFGTPLYSVSLALNILLTFIIVTQLLLHGRRVRNAAGEAGGLYDTIVTMLVESCALYAVSFLLYFGPWADGSSVASLFFPALEGMQVCAVLMLRNPWASLA